MDNKIISGKLNLLSQLMELHGENPFRTKTLSSAAFKIRKLPFPLAAKSLADIEKMEGLGKSTAAKIGELLQSNRIKELEDLLDKTPAGIVEMLQVKGIGPKKVQVIWKELGIENLGELYYACNENRLIEAKGFGSKTQDEIRKVIEFRMASSGRVLYASIEDLAESLQSQLREQWGLPLVSLTGAYRRRCEVLDGLDILAAGVPQERRRPVLETLGLSVLNEGADSLETELSIGLKVRFIFCDPGQYSWNLFIQTGTEDHTRRVSSLIGEEYVNAPDETAIYRKAGLPFIEPELREGSGEVELAQGNRLPTLISFSDLKGCLHNHSTWSDGVHTLEEMALYCRDELKLEYLGISDHSKTAFYADGLKEEQIVQQHEEIDALNARLAPFRIFKGIESDILYDGSLDYADEILETFDFVVASVHSVLKMNEEKATSRLITAIENPYTTILGHPTGRMLLTRSGYPIDHRKVIDACAANNVVIEINSNPLRLDMDWRWHRYAIEKGVMLSVNPDAHRKEGFHDMHYGVLVARKGGVSADNCLNALSLSQIDQYFREKKKRSGT
jgi:DNA polymerase (family X)